MIVRPVATEHLPIFHHFASTNGDLSMTELNSKKKNMLMMANIMNRNMMILWIEHAKFRFNVYENSSISASLASFGTVHQCANLPKNL